MLLNKILGFFIFTFNLIVTIITFMYIFKNINIIFSNLFFIIIFICLLFIKAFTWYFSIAIAIKKQIQKYLGFIQLSGFLTFFYHFILLLIIYINANIEQTENIVFEIFLITGIVSLISNVLLCLTNYGYTEEFINYNYDIERQREEVVVQVNNDIEEPGELYPDPEIEEIEQYGELSISMNAYDTDIEFCKPSAPEYEGAYE